MLLRAQHDVAITRGTWRGHLPCGTLERYCGRNQTCFKTCYHFILQIILLMVAYALDGQYLICKLESCDKCILKCTFNICQTKTPKNQLLAMLKHLAPSNGNGRNIKWETCHACLQTTRYPRRLATTTDDTSMWAVSGERTQGKNNNFF